MKRSRIFSDKKIFVLAINHKDIFRSFILFSPQINMFGGVPNEKIWRRKLVSESASNQDTIEAESTVLYYIYTSASLGHDCVKDFLNSLKILIKAPEFVLSPFLLMVLFSIAAIPHYEETVFEIIRPCIVRSFTEEQRRAHSCWFREMVPTTGKPEEIFSVVIQYRWVYCV